jgi:hypothetical protein
VFNVFSKVTGETASVTLSPAKNNGGDLVLSVSLQFEGFSTSHWSSLSSSDPAITFYFYYLRTSSILTAGFDVAVYQVTKNGNVGTCIDGL